MVYIYKSQNMNFILWYAHADPDQDKVVIEDEYGQWCLADRQ